jgi:hypothetical protein
MPLPSSPHMLLFSLVSHFEKNGQSRVKDFLKLLKRRRQQAIVSRRRRFLEILHNLDTAGQVG